jgi:hypothetical protein
MNSHDDILIATQKALALLAHAIGSSNDARPLLANLMTNYRAAQTPGPATAFDTLATGMLLSLSSLALKQHPQDPDVQRLYRDLRPGARH